MNDDRRESITDSDLWADEPNWVDDNERQEKEETAPAPTRSRVPSTLVVVETAFLASATSLIWLINSYVPPGPILRLFFSIPVALAFLRQGQRAAWMTAIIATLLLTVLMGPTRSILFLMPYGVMGVQLGAMWRRGTSWYFSVTTGALLGVIGLFFRLELISLVLGEDLWVYFMAQFTSTVEWGLTRFGILIQPDVATVQAIALASISASNILYMLAIHLVALFVLDRLDNPIPRPPKWIQVILDYA